MFIRPLRDLVLVRLDRREPNFGDGPIVRPAVAAEKPIWGVVVGVGPGLQTKRGLVPTTVCVGQRVSVPWSTGHDLTIGGEHHVMVHEPDLLALETEA